MLNQAKKLRIGLLINEGSQPQAIFDFLNKSLDAQYYYVETLLIQNNLAENETPLFKKNIFINALEEIIFNFIKKLERKLLSKSARVNTYFKQHSIDSLPFKKLYLADLKHKTLASPELDLLVLAHTVPFEEDYISIATQGLIFVAPFSRQIDLTTIPAGFDDVLFKSPSSTFLIQKIDPNKHAKTLFKGKIYTAYFYLMNAINLLQRSQQHLHLVLEKMGKNQQENLVSPSQEINEEKINPHIFLTPQVPDLWQQICYVAQTALHLCKKKWWKLYKKSMRWGVAYQFTEDWQQADLTKSIMVKNPPNHFLADPFIIEKNGVHYCYVEDYDYASKKGKLTVYEVNHDGFKSLGTALEEDFHLSYPFIFEVSGELFMCPETYQANDIRLYRCVEFPLQWKLHKILKSNVSAADTNIFQWNEKWWMLTNIDSLGLDEHHAELHLFYADAFDASDWTPHPLNPIIFDPLRARNGGLLFKNNAIYRVFQQQGFDNYGEAMGIAKITALDTETYCEELLYNIPADFFKGLAGAHSYAFQEGLLVLDFKRLEITKN